MTLLVLKLGKFDLNPTGQESKQMIYSSTLIPFCNSQTKSMPIYQVLTNCDMNVA